MLEEMLDEIMRFIREGKPGDLKVFVINGEYDYEKFVETVRKRFKDYIGSRTEKDGSIVGLIFLVRDIHTAIIEVIPYLVSLNKIYNPSFTVEILGG